MTEETVDCLTEDQKQAIKKMQKLRRIIEKAQDLCDCPELAGVHERLTCGLDDSLVETEIVLNSTIGGGCNPSTGQGCGGGG